MPAPVLMTSAYWATNTRLDKKKLEVTRKKLQRVVVGNKPRGNRLQQVDTFLQAYNTNSNPSNLEFLKRFLDEWVGSKKQWIFFARDSERNYAGAVTQLKTQVDQATQLRSPTPTQYPGIFIGNDIYRGNNWVPNGFRGAVTNCIDQLRSQPVGQQLLEDLSAECVRSPPKKVVIEYGSRSTAAPIPVITKESRKKVQPMLNAPRYDLDELTSDPLLIAVAGSFDEETETRDFVSGGGTGAVVTFNHTDPGPPGSARPTFVALGHELCHAYHYVMGMCYRAANGGIQDGGNTGLMEEEMRTVGMLAYADEVPSENAIRAEHHIQLRTQYTATDSFANVVATAR